MTATAADARVGSDPGGGLRVLPRRARANSRAVTGGLAVALAVVLVFAAWLTTRPGRPEPYAVTRVPLAAGARMSAADLTTRRLSLPPSVASSAYPATADLIGRVLAVPLRAGQLVAGPELTPIGEQPGLRPVSVEAPSSELADLEPGQPVDVFLTTGSGAGAHTALILRGAEVIRVTAPGGGLLGGGGAGSDVVVLGVTDLSEVETLVAAAHAGSLDVVVAEPSDGSGVGPGPG